MKPGAATYFRLESDPAERTMQSALVEKVFEWTRTNASCNVMIMVCTADRFQGTESTTKESRT